MPRLKSKDRRVDKVGEDSDSSVSWVVVSNISSNSRFKNLC